jgi:hypothetical protein
MRFSLKHHGQLSCVEHCPEGEYVLHSDYARLQAEVERLTDCKAQADRFKAEVERLTDAITSGNAITADAQPVNKETADRLENVEAFYGQLEVRVKVMHGYIKFLEGLCQDQSIPLPTTYTLSLDNATQPPPQTSVDSK